MNDRAFWISWYNLPDEGRSDVLAWTRDVYMPRVLERPGVLWGAHYASQSDFTSLGGGDRISHKQKPGADVPIGRVIFKRPFIQVAFNMLAAPAGTARSDDIDLPAGIFVASHHLTFTASTTEFNCHSSHNMSG